MGTRVGTAFPRRWGEGEGVGNGSVPPVGKVAGGRSLVFTSLIGKGDTKGCSLCPRYVPPVSRGRFPSAFPTTPMVGGVLGNVVYPPVGKGWVGKCLFILSLL